VTQVASSDQVSGTRDKEATKLRLISAIGTLLAREGFDALGVNAVAEEAGVDKVLIYRYFGGMNELLTAFGDSGEFWPSITEVIGDDPSELMNLPLAERWAIGLNRYANALRQRPVTKEILAWELIEQNDLIQVLRRAREEWFGELLGHFPDDPDATDGDLIGTVLLVVGAIHYFVVLGRLQTDFSGIELGTEAGWDHIDQLIATVFRRTLIPRT
jgi:AcrR family transcriptional regulator